MKAAIDSKRGALSAGPAVEARPRHAGELIAAKTAGQGKKARYTAAQGVAVTRPVAAGE